jgi:hypothetical protein
MKKNNMLSRHANMIGSRVWGQKVTFDLDGTEGNTALLSGIFKS